ncbi:hypothetical protein NL476_28065, partial [Klebsiella pneumoniae]|nr:hypothetical protein [Klebsiella pneumoniae]
GSMKGLLISHFLIKALGSTTCCCDDDDDDDARSHLVRQHAESVSSWYTDVDHSFFHALRLATFQ